MQLQPKGKALVAIDLNNGSEIILPEDIRVDYLKGLPLLAVTNRLPCGLTFVDGQLIVFASPDEYPSVKAWRLWNDERSEYGKWNKISTPTAYVESLVKVTSPRSPEQHRYSVWKFPTADSWAVKGVESAYTDDFGNGKWKKSYEQDTSFFDFVKDHYWLTIESHCTW